VSALNTYLGNIAAAARENPGRAQELYVGAAAKLRHAAKNPKNAKKASVLLGIADEIAKLAYEAPVAGPRFTQDDFGELLNDMYDANQAVGSNDIEEKAGQDLLKSFRENEFSTIITPESVKDCVIGRSVNVKFNPTTQDLNNQIAQEQTAVLWQGNKRESQSLTVDVDVLTSPLLITPGISLRPYAKIQFGTDGTLGPVVTVDVGFGQRLTGEGNYVSVAIGMDPPAPGAASGVLQISGRLGFFAAPSIAMVTRTAYLDNIAPLPPVGAGAVQKIPRPLRAQFLNLPQSTDVNGTTRLDFLDSTGTIIYSLSFANGTVVTPIPLSNDVFQINLTNTGSINASYRLPFQVAF
jgi:hypothetical protein